MRLGFQASEVNILSPRLLYNLIQLIRQNLLGAIKHWAAEVLRLTVKMVLTDSSLACLVPPHSILARQVAPLILAAAIQAARAVHEVLAGVALAAEGLEEAAGADRHHLCKSTYLIHIYFLIFPGF